MKKIAFIPIDNRPVCYLLPKQIADLESECELVLPKRELLGDLTKQADTTAIINWLKTLENIDVIVCCLDTIAYGGLISSRRTNDTTDTIKQRINDFIDVIKKNNAEVYAFSSIMRISNNNVNEEEKLYWKDYGRKLFDYSYELHKTGMAKAEKFGIPEEILQDYLQGRKRNFEINKYYIKLAKQNIFKTLVFSKDDCAKFGLNVQEAEELKKLSENLTDIYIKTGADEIPLSLISRALNKHKHIKIFPKYLKPDFVDNISKYEDISVKESVESQLELCGAVVTQNEEDSDMVLLVNNFADEQGELVMNVDVPLFCGELELPDKPYLIADIMNANGSDNNFCEELLKLKHLKEFYGYAAWNTTGNTLGSVISAALTYFGAKKPNREAFDILQLTRFLDDWAYQANVRKEIRNNDENLKNGIVKQKMQSFEEKLVKAFALKNIDIEYKFPWNRFFETEIDISKTYANVAFVDILFYE